MHKLVILIETLPEDPAFEDLWPQFLHLCERMPGLRREATSRVERRLYGGRAASLVHELFFDSAAAVTEAMGSPPGRQAGELLQRLTGGKMNLWIADHKEDIAENLLRHTQEGSEHE